MRIATILNILKGEILGNNPNTDTDIQELIIDARKIANAPLALFIALKGHLRNGHQFIEQAYLKGIRYFLISDDLEPSQYPGALFIKVDNTLAGLQKIGKYQRAQFDYPVIGITGSNGKTIVKEWLYELLSQVAPFNEKAGPVRSPKSYNSQIGIPLSTWLMQEENTIGIFEAGISKPEEMAKAEAIIQPTIGIFTNIGEAHNEGFESIELKIKEKLKLFDHAQQLIYCKDHSRIDQCIADWQTTLENTAPHFFTWSTKDSEATLFIKNISTKENLSLIEAIYENKEVSIEIPYQDSGYIENAIHCWACLLMLGLVQVQIKEIMKGLQPVAMRLQLLAGINNCTLINDTYNSDYTSLKIAIDFLIQQKTHDRKTIILSDILEVRQDRESFYARVAQLLHSKGINGLIGIGPNIKKYQFIFAQYGEIEQKFFESTDEFVTHFQAANFSNETILLKGARTFEFEKIERLLEEKKHKTVMEVDLSAIQNNLSVYKNMLQPGVKLMAMVKAFAYGTGSVEIANVLQYEGVDYLTVAYLDEGIALRKAGITLPIMVMSPEFGAFDQMISWKIEPEIFSLDSLKAFIKAAASKNTEHYPIHLKLDTGMHRLGFNEADIPMLIQQIQKTDAVIIKSVFSHLAGSDEAKFDGFTEHQTSLFNSMSATIQAAFTYKIWRHISNTSAISRFPDLQYDMVRLGIGMYGIDANESVQKQLQNVATLKTTIAQLRTVKAGETIGYSRRAKLERDSQIATVSIGYADGYFRDFGNGIGHMLVNGKAVPTLGSVCMDMCMLDVSDIPNIQAGDMVVVFGSALPPTVLAKWANTIPYEIITSVSQRVKRIYLNES